MSERGAYARRSFRERPEDNVYDSTTSYLPKSLTKILKDASDKYGLPVSRLVAIAIDNEQECQDPFAYDVSCPDVPYVENEYATEAGKIYDFLKKVKTGMGIDTLVTFRRDIGVPDKKRLLLGLRELLKVEMAEEYFNMHTKFRYSRDYMHIRAVTGFLQTKQPADKRNRKTIVGSNV